MVDINNYAPRSGRLIREDNTIINEANGINADGSRNVQLTGRYLTQSPIESAQVTVNVAATPLLSSSLLPCTVITVRNAGLVAFQMCNADGTGSMTLDPGDVRVYHKLAGVQLYAKVASGTGTAEVEGWQ